MYISIFLCFHVTYLLFITYQLYSCVYKECLTAVAQWLRCCATNRKVRWFDPSWCQWIFFIDIKYFRSHYGPEVDSVSNRNEYQAYFLGVKADGA